ncbi:MAG: ATP-binding protein, partial [Bacteroidota bacterium]|nr:ATP-binding protein [Bacteroidota bacterium]
MKISRYKFNIILWYTGLLSVLLTVIFVIIYSLLSYQLINDIDEDLADKAEWIEPRLREIDDPYMDRRFYDYLISRRYDRRMDANDVFFRRKTEDDNYLVFVYTGEVLRFVSDKYEFLREEIEPASIEHQTIERVQIDTLQFMMTAVDKGGYTLYLGYDLSSVKSIQKKILQILLWVLPIGILLSILVGYFITQRSLRVIKNITKTASNITSKNLSKRIKKPKGNDEITDLIVRLNSMIDRLEKSFNMVQQFSQDAAHEIRTPLTIIRGEIEMFLENDTYPKEVSNKLESILEEIQYLSSLSESLLLIHKLDTSKIEYHFTTVDLSQIINEIHDDAQILSYSKNISVSLEAKDDVKIKGNKELITRLLWNLIDNSVKYNKKNGKIIIKLVKKSSEAVLSIEDTGVGIPSNDLNKIFDRFYRVDKSRSR